MTQVPLYFQRSLPVGCILTLHSYKEDTINMDSFLLLTMIELTNPTAFLWVVSWRRPTWCGILGNDSNEKEIRQITFWTEPEEYTEDISCQKKEETGACRSTHHCQSFVASFWPTKFGIVRKSWPIFLARKMQNKMAIFVVLSYISSPNVAIYSFVMKDCCYNTILLLISPVGKIGRLKFKDLMQNLDRW